VKGFHFPAAAHFLQRAFPHELALLRDEGVDYLVPVNRGKPSFDGDEFVVIFPLVELPRRGRSKVSFK
jgi:hypothetical protein